MLTVIVDCPLYIRSQIHRHRTFSYNEVSRRYTSENLEFYVPPVDDIRTQHTSNKQASGAAIELYKAQQLQGSIKHAHAYALDFFNTLVDAGVARERAWEDAPQNLMTIFI
jgi:thymidylate synthase (FAD)